ncbi:MAG: hypothetical protein HC855_02595 [Rhizobiales bacterium]|nr:hypothetical protein [Hyphomicrobiales bacterium]
MRNDISIKPTHTPAELRRLAARVKDAKQSRRLLSIAAALDGMSRAEAARTGRIGDGKIFVLDLEGVMRVRTGEVGADAL